MKQTSTGPAAHVRWLTPDFNGRGSRTGHAYAAGFGRAYCGRTRPAMSYPTPGEYGTYCSRCAQITGTTPTAK